MTTAAWNQALKQLKHVLTDWEQLSKKSKHDDLSDLPDYELVAMLTRAHAAIENSTQPSSAYRKQADRIQGMKTSTCFKLMEMIGVVKSVRTDIEAGFCQSISELMHGELFADFLEMAQHLLDSGYKDAAAVLAGGTIEQHLRQLAIKYSLPTTTSNSTGVVPRKAEQINQDLAAAAVYSKLDQKNVTAWLDLRNKAAHAQYTSYTVAQVELLISSIRDFIIRIPA